MALLVGFCSCHEIRDDQLEWAPAPPTTEKKIKFLGEKKVLLGYKLSFVIFQATIDLFLHFSEYLFLCNKKMKISSKLLAIF